MFEGGCDDALFGARDGAQYGAFDRKADSFSEALASAIRDVTCAVTGLQIVRIEPDELVTLAAIAERSGLSREYIRLLSANKRGPGGFPAPVAYADHKTRLWHWPDVAHWEETPSPATEGRKMHSVPFFQCQGPETPRVPETSSTRPPSATRWRAPPPCSPLADVRCQSAWSSR